MEADGSSSKYSTPCVTIVTAGDQKVYAHASVLKKAEMLGKMVEGPWKEAHDKVIHLQDWDAETVARLVDYLYTHDYRCPLPTPKGSEQAAEFQADQGSEKESPAKQHFMSKIPPRKQRILCQKMNYLMRENSPFWMAEGSPDYENFVNYERKVNEFQACEWDWFIPIMTHAKLYALSTFLLLPSLQELSLCRLAYTMITNISYPIDPERTVTTTAVLRYIYTNTPCLADGDELARDFVSTYVAACIDQLDRTVVNQLIEEGGDCAVDIFTHLKNMEGKDEFDLRASFKE